MKDRSNLLRVVGLAWWLAAMFCLPSVAQGQSTADLDPQARQYALSLYGVYQQAQYSNNWNAF